KARGHQTQWAAQFAVASELCKRGYEVAFTSGHTTPVADLMAASPVAKTMFLIDVKGLYAPMSRSSRKIKKAAIPAQWKHLTLTTLGMPISTCAAWPSMKQAMRSSHGR